MTALGRWCIGIIIALIVLGVVAVMGRNASTPPPSTLSVATTTPVETYGMSEYTDPTYGFTFWYPNTLQITASTTQDDKDFPGGVAVETLLVGSQGGTAIIVVDSPTATITDESANHASPIAQTKYFYDSAAAQWMVAYPQGTTGPGSGATTTADISKTTLSGLLLLPSGRRFDTSIIPLGTTRFLVISDGGGSSFTLQLAQTVAQTGAAVDPSKQAAALQAEAAAYAKQ